MDSNEVEDLVKSTTELLMDITSNKKKALEMVKTFDISSSIKKDCFVPNKNPLPKNLCDIKLIMNTPPNNELFLGGLRKCIDFIDRIIENLEKMSSDPQKGWGISSCQLELEECYQLASFLGREIKSCFVKIVENSVEL